MKNTEIILDNKFIEILFKNISSSFITKLTYKFINDYQLILVNVTFESKDNKSISTDRKSTRLNSSHSQQSRMPSSA